MMPINREAMVAAAINSEPNRWRRAVEQERAAYWWVDVAYAFGRVLFKNEIGPFSVADCLFLAAALEAHGRAEIAISRMSADDEDAKRP